MSLNQITPNWVQSKVCRVHRANYMYALDESLLSTIHGSLRNRKLVLCFYWFIATQVEVWENKICCGNTSQQASMLTDTSAVVRISLTIYSVTESEYSKNSVHYFIVFYLKWTGVVMGNIHKECMCNAGHKGLHVWGVHEGPNRFTSIAVNQTTFLVSIMCIQSLC